MSPYRAVMIMLSVCGSYIGCKSNDDMQSPCSDTAQLVTVTTGTVHCHPQASIHAAPVASGETVLVTCTCNILPEQSDSGCHRDACESLPLSDGGTEPEQ